jgi:Zn-dependent protease
MSGMNFPYLLEAALMAVVLLFSIIVHEVAHGYVALLNGDPTARMLGRLTLNPVPHIDMVGSILVPGLLLLSGSSFLIGWAKPVPVNPLNFRNYRWGEFAVSAAGPLSNLILAAMFSIVLRLGVENPGLIQLASYGVMINILLGLFNLIPIPPLDGSHIMALVLPRELARLYGYLQPVGMVIIIILMFTGILWKILLPLVKQVALIMLG